MGSVDKTLGAWQLSGGGGCDWSSSMIFDSSLAEGGVSAASVDVAGGACLTALLGVLACLATLLGRRAGAVLSLNPRGWWWAGSRAGSRAEQGSVPLAGCCSPSIRVLVALFLDPRGRGWRGGRVLCSIPTSTFCL